VFLSRVGPSVQRSRASWWASITKKGGRGDLNKEGGEGKLNITPLSSEDNKEESKRKGGKIINGTETSGRKIAGETARG